MGYHEEIQTALAVLLEDALPGVPILNGLTASVDEVARFPKCVLIVRESISYDPHEPINPDPTETQQPEMWTWSIGVKGGAGASTAANAGAEVDKLLEAVRTALGAQRLSNKCGPLHLELEDYRDESGRGVVYTQTWVHERF